MRNKTAVWAVAATVALLAVALASWWFFKKRGQQGSPAPAYPATFRDRPPKMSTSTGQSAVNALFSATTSCAEVASILRGSITDLTVEQERNGGLDDAKIMSTLESAVTRMNTCDRDAWVKLGDIEQPMMVSDFQTILRAMLIAMKHSMHAAYKMMG